MRKWKLYHFHKQRNFFQTDNFPSNFCKSFSNIFSTPGSLLMNLSPQLWPRDSEKYLSELESICILLTIGCDRRIFWFSTILILNDLWISKPLKRLTFLKFSVPIFFIYFQFYTHFHSNLYYPILSYIFMKLSWISKNWPSAIILWGGSLKTFLESLFMNLPCYKVTETSCFANSEAWQSFFGTSFAILPNNFSHHKWTWSYKKNFFENLT